MAQHTQGKGADSSAAKLQKIDTDGVVDIAHYRQPEDAGSSAFVKVMAQMNINDRNAFDKKYEQLWREASHDSSLLSVLLCDIDFFKAYKDNYGEQRTSFMLLMVGLELKKICDEHSCFLAHYEREEFAILHKGGDSTEVLDIAESLRKAVETSRTEHKFSKVSAVVTLSVGVSSIYPNSMKLLMQKANSKLQQAKTAGLNQVHSDILQNQGETTPTVTTNNAKINNTVEAPKAPVAAKATVKDETKPVASNTPVKNETKSPQQPIAAKAPVKEAVQAPIADKTTVKSEIKTEKETITDTSEINEVEDFNNPAPKSKIKSRLNAFKAFVKKNNSETGNSEELLTEAADEKLKNTEAEIARTAINRTIIKSDVNTLKSFVKKTAKTSDINTSKITVTNSKLKSEFVSSKARTADSLLKNKATVSANSSNNDLDALTAELADSKPAKAPIADNALKNNLDALTAELAGSKPAKAPIADNTLNNNLDALTAALNESKPKEPVKQVTKKPVSDNTNNNLDALTAALAESKPKEPVSPIKDTSANLNREGSFKARIVELEIGDKAALTKNFERLWEECRAEREFLSLVISGIDYFKPYIENYGEQVIEKTLATVASSFHKIGKKHGAFIYYLGGEKFVVLLKGGNATKALKMAEQIRKTVAETSTEHKHSRVSNVVTMSLGLSSVFPNNMNSIEMLKEEAADAYDMAIRSGRNQTCLS